MTGNNSWKRACRLRRPNKKLARDKRQLKKLTTRRNRRRGFDENEKPLSGQDLI